MGDGAPLFSVIVPVRDDAPGIARTLAGLHRQTLDADRYEVLVVDNGSRDATAATARGAAGEGPARVTVLVEGAVPTSYGARNAGIRAARGHLLSFVDAGMDVPPDYLARVAEAFDAGLDYAGCPVEVTVARPTVAACHNRLFGFPVARYLAGRQWVPTCCLTVRREVVDVVGGFADGVASGGDVDFGRRVAAAGFRQGLVQGTRLGHPARERVRDLTRKARRTARGKAQLAALSPVEHGEAVRAYASASRLRPPNPARIRADLAVASLPATWPRAVGVAALTSWLGVVRLVAATVESHRLRSRRGDDADRR